MRESKQYKDAIMRESKDIEAWRTLQGHSHAGVQDIEAWRTVQVFLAVKMNLRESNGKLQSAWT